MWSTAASMMDIGLPEIRNVVNWNDTIFCNNFLSRQTTYKHILTHNFVQTLLTE